MPRPSHQPDADLRRLLANAVPEAEFDLAWAAYEEARIAGLCHEGAWEVALGTRTEPASHAHRDAQHHAST